MPVNNRRFAAVNRTPAADPGSRSRLRLTLTWLTIVTALTFFTFTVAATAAGSKPDYAGAAKGLRADQPRVVIKTGARKGSAPSTRRSSRSSMRHTRPAG